MSTVGTPLNEQQWMFAHVKLSIKHSIVQFTRRVVGKTTGKMCLQRVFKTKRALINV